MAREFVAFAPSHDPTSEEMSENRKIKDLENITKDIRKDVQNLRDDLRSIKINPSVTLKSESWLQRNSYWFWGALTIALMIIIPLAGWFSGAFSQLFRDAVNTQIESKLTQPLTDLRKLQIDVAAIGSKVDTIITLGGVNLKHISQLDAETFQKSLPILRKALEQSPLQVKTDQETLHKIAAKLRETPESSLGYWPATLQFLSFLTMTMAPDVAASTRPPDIIISSGNNVSHLRLSDKTVLVDGGTISDSTFVRVRMVVSKNGGQVTRNRFFHSALIFEFATEEQPQPPIKDAIRTLLASDFAQQSPASTP